MVDLENDPELQLDLNTDEISAHLKRKAKQPESDTDTDAENDDNTVHQGDEEKVGEDEDDDDEEEGDKAADEDKQIYEKQAAADKKAKKKTPEDENDDDQDDDLYEEEDDQDETNHEAKILITTTELKVSFKTYKLCRELSRILPNSNYFYRKNVRISKVIPEAIKRNYSALIVINEDRKIPSMKIYQKNTHTHIRFNSTILEFSVFC